MSFDPEPAICFCSSGGAVICVRRQRRRMGRIASERKYLTVLCADLQRSTDLITDLDPEEAISRF